MEKECYHCMNLDMDHMKAAVRLIMQKNDCYHSIIHGKLVLLYSAHGLNGKPVLQFTINGKSTYNEYH